MEKDIVESFNKESFEIDLGGVWRFTCDFKSEDVMKGLNEGCPCNEAWLEVNVPSVFDDYMPGIPEVRGSAWYRKSFAAPDRFHGKKAVIVFDAVNFHTKVWLNGKFAGGNNLGFLPFEIPITEFLEYGQENSITVWVSNELEAWELPPFFGWRNQGGIIRDVKIVFYEFLHISDVRINAIPDANNGLLKVSVIASNETNVYEEANIRIKIFDSELKEKAVIDSCIIKIDGNETGEIEVADTLKDINPWFPDSPCLYLAEVMLIKGDVVKDTACIRFGFRKIDIKESKLYLNNKLVFLLGFNRHDETFKTGMALDRKETCKDLVNMKSTGANFIRMCHYPHSSYELSLCDEMGFMVLAEIPFTFHNKEEHIPKQQEIAGEYLKRIIARDKNHPSIIIWSVSNETQEQLDVVNNANDELIKLAKKLDPTRLVTHVSQSVHWTSEKVSGIFRYDDVISINDYPTFDSRSNDVNYDFSRSFDLWTKNFKHLRELYPQKPIVVTEFGYATKQEVDGEKDEEVQALAIETEFKAMTEDLICGCSIWCYADHLWPVFDMEGVMQDISPYGLHNRDRSEKQAFNLVKHLFKEKFDTKGKKCLYE